MFYITRKATGKVVAQVGRKDWLDAVLWNLPAGVYGIEDSDGNEVNVATVKAGRVAFAK
jgi:hypothetical protein